MKHLTFLLALTLWAITAVASPLVVQNFDTIAIGTEWPLWGRYGNLGNSTAVVAADPQNPSNHVLHVKIATWNVFPEFQVPAEYAGQAMGQRFTTVRFRINRSSSDPNEYKQMQVFYGEGQIFCDNGFPSQGAADTWHQRNYPIGDITDAGATALRLGLQSDVTEYYLDDVQLVGEFDDYVSYPSQELNLCQKNTSSSYTVYTTPTLIPEGARLNVYTSRYTDFNAPLAGMGRLNIYSGGERTYLGEHSNKSYPSWQRFDGPVHIYPHKAVEPSLTMYGVIMAHNGKTFQPENVEECLASGKVCDLLARNAVTLHEGASLAFENGTRAARIAHFDTEAGSRIYGYYKATAGAGGYLVVGDSTDATLAGRIAPMESGGKPLTTCLVGLIKMGKGTYTLTANDNVVSGAVRVKEGRVDICNDAAAALAGKLSGGTGTPASGASAAYVYSHGVLGGTGNIAGPVDVYGTLEPGTATATGELRLADYVSGAATTLRIHPEGTLRFKIHSASQYDRLTLSHDIERDVIREDFVRDSVQMPRIRVVLDESHDVKAGDEFVLITARQRLKADEWKWRVRFPQQLTWRVEERRQSDGTYALTAIVTSLEDDPDWKEEDDDNDHPDPDADKDDYVYGADEDTNPLRYYADSKQLRIGVAVPSSRLAITDPADYSTQLIRNEFNMVVTENELKFDWVEPAQGVFNFTEGDRLLALAEANGMTMRGHTLAWHSQVAKWVSDNGKKNDKGWTRDQLLDILKKHIFAVVGHYKGRIAEWDVVNECLDDDQTIVRTQPDGYKLRAQSVWTLVCGEAFIDSAFVWARQADPEARLILNDYGNETMGSAKAQAFYNLARRLKQSGIPIDGVGFQCHLDAGKVDATAIGQNLERYAPLGLSCVVTELDLGIDFNAEYYRQQQARDYYRVVRTAMAQPHCRSVLVWGLSDDMSWRVSSPLLYDASRSPKPAYYGVRRALAEAESVQGLPAVSQSQASHTVYYSITGQRLIGPAPEGLTIVIERHANGTVSLRKELR